MKRVFIVTIVSFTCLSIGLSTLQYLTFGQTYGLTLKLSPDQDTILTGEGVTIYFQVKKNLPSNLNPHTCGFIRLYVAHNDASFREVVSSGEIQIENCEVYDQATTPSNWILKRKLLWNHVPETSHLNSEAARQFMTGKINNHYIFAEPGSYRIKGILKFVDDTTPVVESNTITVHVSEPKDENLAVWERIRHRADIAYFLQTGRIAPMKAIDPSEFASEIESIVTGHPDTRYSAALCRSLEAIRRYSGCSPK